MAVDVFGGVAEFFVEYLVRSRESETWHAPHLAVVANEALERMGATPIDWSL